MRRALAPAVLAAALLAGCLSGGSGSGATTTPAASTRTATPTPTTATPTLNATPPPPDIAWKAQALDTNVDGRDDVVKLTYLAGPSHVPAANVAIAARSSTGTPLAPLVAHAGDWSPGDYETFALPLAAMGSSCFVSVNVLGLDVLDQTLRPT